MGVRNCKELGENLQKIVSRLMANDNLVKLLYYTDADPLSKTNLTDDQKKDFIFNKLIKIVPKVTVQETTQSIIAIHIANGLKINSNKEFKLIQIVIEVFTPWDQWIFKSSNLRPFAVLGEIQESLEGKTINGLGKISGGDFEVGYFTDEISCYKQTFDITTYD